MKIRSTRGLLGATELRPRRRGITIIEVVVLMTLVAAMLGLCVILLRFLMRVDGENRARLEMATALSRLGRQYRADVHSSPVATLLDPRSSPPGLRLEPRPGRRVEYRNNAAGAIDRVETENGTVIRRESYAVARAGSVRFAVREELGKKYPVIVVEQRSSANRPDSSRDRMMLALLGRDLSENAGPPASAAGGAKP